MHANVMKRVVPLASLFGALGIVAACGSSESDPEETGGTQASGGTAGSGGTPASGGAAGSGIGGTSGTAGSGGIPSGGTAGASCPPGPTPVIVPRAEDGGAGGEGGAGGAGGADAFLCYPGLVCFGPAVATPGMSFIHAAFPNVGASSTGVPQPYLANESGLASARVRYPEPGKVCMSGDDGAGLNLSFSGGQLWDGTNIPPVSLGGPFHATTLGITAVSFTVETPPSTGVTPGFITFGPACGQIGGGRAEQDGNPLVITSSGTTFTLSLATDFDNQFDTNAINGFTFAVGQGPYDYCVTDLRFLDANGDEVTP